MIWTVIYKNKDPTFFFLGKDANQKHTHSGDSAYFYKLVTQFYSIDE